MNPTSGGDSQRRARAHLIERTRPEAWLRRFAQGEGFDEQPMLGLESEALEFADEHTHPAREPGLRPRR